MHQPVESPEPESVNVNGREIEGDGYLITLWGIATRQPNGKYHAYAGIYGVAPAIVELTLSFPQEGAP